MKPYLAIGFLFFLACNQVKSEKDNSSSKEIGPNHVQAGEAKTTIESIVDTQNVSKVMGTLLYFQNCAVYQGNTYPISIGAKFIGALSDYFGKSLRVKGTLESKGATHILSIEEEVTDPNSNGSEILSISPKKCDVNERYYLRNNTGVFAKLVPAANAMQRFSNYFDLEVAVFGKVEAQQISADYIQTKDNFISITGVIEKDDNGKFFVASESLQKILILNPEMDSGGHIPLSSNVNKHHRLIGFITESGIIVKEAGWYGRDLFE